MAVEAEHRLRRIGISTLDGRDIGQSEDLSVCHEIDVSQIGFRAKSAGYVDANLFVRCLNDASGRHGILCLNGLNQSLAIEVKSGELMRRKFNVDFLVLCAKKIDFRNIVDGEK